MSSTEKTVSALKAGNVILLLVTLILKERHSSWVQVENDLILSSLYPFKSLLRSHFLLALWTET